MIEIKFVKTHPDAVLPAKKEERAGGDTCDAGLDLFAVEDTVIPSSSIKQNGGVDIGYAVVPVGLTVGYIQPGWWCRIQGRSGLGFKEGIVPFQGTIDNQFRGDLGVKLFNLTAHDYLVKKGDKIAQLVPYINVEVEASFIDAAVPTNRGEDGFGSSGR